jgi:putative glutathione S-transferase
MKRNVDGVHQAGFASSQAACEEAFNAVYFRHFKCNKRRVVDYPNPWAYTRDLYQVPDVAGTVRMDHIKRHYYGSQRTVNPTGVVPKGPEIDFTAPHDRGGRGQD